MAERVIKPKVKTGNNTADEIKIPYNVLSNPPDLSVYVTTENTTQNIGGKKTVVTPPDTDDSTQIANTAWVRSHNQAIRGFDGPNYYTVNGVKKYYPDDNYFLVAYTDHCVNWQSVCAEIDVVDVDTRRAVYKLKVSGLLESATSNNITTYTNKGNIGVTDSFGERLNTGSTDINNEFFLVCRTTNKGRVRYEIWYNQRYSYNRHKFYFSLDEAHARTGITQHFTWNKMRIDNAADIAYAKAGVTEYMDSKNVNPTYIPTSSWGVDVFKTALSNDESYTNVTIFNNNLYSTTQVGVSTILNTTPYIDAKIKGYSGYKTIPTAAKTAEYRILSEDKGYLGGIRYDRGTDGYSTTRLSTTSTLSGANNAVALYASKGTADTKSTDANIWSFAPVTNNNINLGTDSKRWNKGYITNIQGCNVINSDGDNLTINGTTTVVTPPNKDNSNQIATTAWAGRRYKSIADFGFTSQTTVKAIVQKIIDNWYEYCTFACTNDNFNNFSDTPDGYGTLIIEVGSNALRPLISFTKQIGDSNSYKHWQANIVRGENNQVTEIQWYEIINSNLPQTISGAKTFTNNIVCSKNYPIIDLRHSLLTHGAYPTEARSNEIRFLDKDDYYEGGIRFDTYTDGTQELKIMSRSFGTSNIAGVTLRAKDKASSADEGGAWILHPSTDGSMDLGASSKRWRNGYITNIQLCKVINGGGGNSLIQQNSDTSGADIIVGSTNCPLKILGSGSRPTYRQGKNGTYANLALQSDIPTALSELTDDMKVIVNNTDSSNSWAFSGGGNTAGAGSTANSCIAIGPLSQTRYQKSIRIGTALGQTPTDQSVTQIGVNNYTSSGRALYLGAGYTGFTYMNAAGSSWASASDIRDKTDIQTIDHALDFIKKLKPITYVMNDRERYLIRDKDDNPILDENGKQQYDVEAHKRGDKKKHRRFAGLSAQDTYQAMLDCYNNDTNYAQIVDNNKFDHPDDEYLEQYSMSYERLVPFLIKAVQEQQEQIEKLKSKLGE